MPTTGKTSKVSGWILPKGPRLTVQGVWDKLEKAGIPEDSGDIDDYERAKETIFGKLAVNTHDYERMIKVICAYVGV